MEGLDPVRGQAITRCPSQPPPQVRRASFDENGAHTESGRETYLQAHVPGAVFVDQLIDLTVHDGEAPFEAAPSEQVARVLGEAGIGDDHTVVVYDVVNGIWATRLWWQLEYEGHRDVVVLDGGLRAWQDAGLLPVATGEETHPPATFTPNRRPELAVATASVEAATSDSSVLLINALDRDSFAAARIPGSVNVPFSELVDDQGRLRDLDELRPLFDAVGALDPSVAPVAYCGGGIAATAVAFALKGLGRDVAVYDGSMNAWSADPTRPLERD